MLSDTHQVSISQQMRRVIAFDIAVVKVVIEDRCDLKKRWWISHWSGWLLELLTELKRSFEFPLSSDFCFSNLHVLERSMEPSF